MYRVTKGAVLALLLLCVRVLLQTDVVGSLSGRRRCVLYTVIRGAKGFVRPARWGRCGPWDNRGLGHWRRRFDLLNVVRGNEAFPSVEPTRPPVRVGLIDNLNDVPSREDEILRVLDTIINEDGEPKVKRLQHTSPFSLYPQMAFARTTGGPALPCTGGGGGTALFSWLEPSIFENLDVIWDIAPAGLAATADWSFG
jgi:hypothetical protein